MLFAHTRPGYPPDSWQLLSAHARQTAAAGERFADPLASAAWVRAAAALHDIGKADAEFQAYLLAHAADPLHDDDADGGTAAGRSARARINHSSAGAAYALRRYGPAIGKVLAYLVAGHHAGLPDGTRSGGFPNAALEMRLEEGQKNLGRLAHDVASRGAELGIAGLPDPRDLVPPPFAREKAAHLHFWIRMLFSCLVDADYLDTEAAMRPDQALDRGGAPTLAHLRERFDSFMARKTAEADATAVNAARAEILAACRAAALHEPGVFSLNVPTGGGKTLASMAFALDHAVRYGQARIVYVIPYTSIVEQTAAVFAGIFGADNVLEHHANVEPERETPRSRLAAENWDAPVVVTTNVQFFESLYAARSSRCRKLHRLAASVVVLDEAHLVPPELRAPCVDALRQLAAGYGTTLVLSTATQPPFPELQPRLIITDAPALFARLRRTRLVLPARFDAPTPWPELAERLARHASVLCIVNRKRDALALWRLLPEGTVHLSTWMCAAHRRAALEGVRRRLRDGLAVRVVSTQLVEAGVDLDFPVVYRALAGLDSLAQAAGRCNREGRAAAPGEVHVFVPPEKSPPGLLRKGEDAARELLALPDVDPEGPDIFARYFGLLRESLNRDGTDIVKVFTENAATLDFPFRTEAAKFRLIADGGMPVLVRYGAGEALADEIRRGGISRALWRRAQRFCVSVPSRRAGDLVRKGLVEELADGLYAQTSFMKYEPGTGLASDQDDIDPANLMV